MENNVFACVYFECVIIYILSLSLMKIFTRDLQSKRKVTVEARFPFPYPFSIPSKITTNNCRLHLILRKNIWARHMEGVGEYRRRKNTSVSMNYKICFWKSPEKNVYRRDWAVLRHLDLRSRGLVSIRYSFCALNSRSELLITHSPYTTLLKSRDLHLLCIF